MNSNIIFIIGLMGSGKTSIGKALSKKINRKFFDTDQEIIRNENSNIGQIFNRYGENYFRELEYKTLLKLKDNNNSIISTGGGIVLKKENIDIMKNNGIIIFLNIDVKEQIMRIKNKKNRPLLDSKDPEKDLLNMKDSRDKVYNSIANLKIDVSSDTKNGIVNRIKVYLNEKNIT
ncbi:MAG: shikimate kinase [Pseudomonadota bacterium]|nr:shikimate kinase [Pseudomonadota bacterium]